MTGPDASTSSRRAVLAGAGATCVAALAGCATYNANHGGLAGAPPAQNSPAATGGENANGNGSPGDVLASTSDIPVGGGKILADKKIVITQPHAGTFDAFTAVCTHQGCIVTTVSGGTITQARIALTGVGPTPLRASEAEALLAGRALEGKLAAGVIEAVRAATDPETDLHASSDYRRHLAGVLAGRAVAAAWRRANESAA